MADLLIVAGILVWIVILGVIAVSWGAIGDYMRAALTILALGYLSILAAQLPDVPEVGALLMQVGGSGLLFAAAYFTYQAVEERQDGDGD